MLIDLKHPALEFYGLAGAGAAEAVLTRMPQEAAEKVSPAVGRLARHLSGGRVRFATDSPTLHLRVHYEEIAEYSHMSITSVAGLDLYEQRSAALSEPLAGWQVDYESQDAVVSQYLQTFQPPFETYRTREAEWLYEAREGGVRGYTVYLPIYSSLASLELELADGAVLERHPYPYRNRDPWVFYGSSITQGACASRPGNTYIAHLERRFNLNVRGLGFSGSAKGELAMADYLVSQPMEALVLDYDYNAPDVEWLRETHEPFFRRVREARPELPIYILTAGNLALSAAHAEVLAERRAVIRQTYLNAVAAGDECVYYKDLSGVFGFGGGQSASVDHVHPTDLGFWALAEEVAALIEGGLVEG